MRAGKLRHRVDILEKSATRNEFGEEVIQWAVQETFWAAIEPLTGREYLDARQATIETSHRVRLRPGRQVRIQADQRVRYGERVFLVVSVADIDERGRELVLMCRELLPEVTA